VLGAALLAVLLAQAAAPPAPGRSASVGSPARLAEIVLPGPELVVRPASFATPISLRIVAVHPHGSDRRYELEWYGLEPGTFDLADFLARQDGSSTADLPELLVEVRSVLPPGQVQPAALAPIELPAVGGYKKTLVAGAVVWLLGLGAFLALSRRRSVAAHAAQRPATLAERLCPLVERAIAGTLPGEDLARLELFLIAHWRERLHLQAEDPARALATLRAHPEAGPLFLGLESWLHRPERAGAPDVAALLAPYRDLPSDTLELEG
jgi:hypothetical protein